jgi:hypothetical protein
MRTTRRIFVSRQKRSLFDTNIWEMQRQLTEAPYKDSGDPDRRLDTNSPPASATVLGDQAFLANQPLVVHDQALFSQQDMQAPIAQAPSQMCQAPQPRTGDRI